MKKPKLAVTSMDKSIEELASRTNHKILAIWAADRAERALPYFEKRYPEENRPRKAIATLRTWVQTGVFKMADIRGAALAAHAAAREVEDNDAALSAARAAGQAVATAHVPRHALAAAIYQPPLFVTPQILPMPILPRSRNVTGNINICLN
jgi:hypothetical protein